MHMHSQMHLTSHPICDTINRQLYPPLRSGGGGAKPKCLREEASEGDNKLKSNSNQTFNRYTAGTPLPTAENSYRTADGKNNDQYKPNEIQTKMSVKEF